MRLSVPQERWGWEFTAPAPAQPSPLRERAPRWVDQPPPAHVLRDQRRARVAPKVFGAGCVLSVWAAGLAAAWGIALWPLVMPAGALVSAGWCAQAVLRASASRRVYLTWREGELAEYQRAQAQWCAQVNEHERREQLRVSASQLWHPVGTSRPARRVDVFGGTADGWSSLLGTLGMSLLAEDAQLLVLDFTEQHVAADLAGLARTSEHAVSFIDPAGGGVGLLDGLSPRQIGETVAEAVSTLRIADARSAQASALDAELITLVAQALSAPVTFARLAAGVRVLRSVYEAEHENWLSAAEVLQLNRLVDSVGPGESVREELRFLGAVLGLLSDSDAEFGGNALGWPRSGLAVVETSGSSARGKDLLDRIVFHRVLHTVRVGQHAADRAVLVVAGADHLGLAAVEALARHTHRAGVRLIVMLEHLRGEFTQLLGGGDSASILMRLGNAAEASAAADFVGRGHRFVLSQLTDQIGRSFTEGASDTAGDSVTSTTSDSFSGGSASTSGSLSRASTWSRTTSWSGSDSTSHGRTYARAYEYTVEPTTFQALPATAFILVETGAHDRRVVAGDCNPGIALLDRVATQPRRHHGHRT
ncbi:hypothetical protein [Nocardia asiatica]|uniref:hypothetical protein n=1 Tax=Nocardia asiatica TaxID=209252 RepID=UPI0024537537|nr:hypothetical protein [Nocardia asiatica]